MTEIDRWGDPVERVQPDRPPAPPPMTVDELDGLVKAVIAYTGRESSEALATVWIAQAQLGRWTYVEAMAALHAWARDHESGAFLEPSDITRSVRAARRDAALAGEAARARVVDPGAAERLRRGVAQVASRLGWADREQRREAGALAVPCPWCGAREGEPCRNSHTGRPLTASTCHPGRTEALAAAREAGQ